ncbi:DUF3631 domain-containing protein [Geminicoccus harenae]|uniref:DUF3631 domain-containing protein n=1 Tax=Geminicoccus harenae TaxID=2498453 RepID=UPI00168C0028|nr:DUF3631 domain-containing protein [Geminicoccus harenae]
MTRDDEVKCNRFLSRIVPLDSPGSGFGCVQRAGDDQKDSRKIRMGSVRAFDTISGMSDRASRWEHATGDAAARSVYFAPATFDHAEPVTDSTGKPYLKGHRVQEHFKAIKSMWLDIDLKAPDKPANRYETAEEAVQAVDRFVSDTDLPSPSYIVHTGNGIHVYWVLNDPITDAAQWRDMNSQLLAAADASDLAYDPAPSSNLVGLMRVPFTTNRKDKGQPKPVTIVREDPNDIVNEAITQALSRFVPRRRGQHTPASNKLAGWDFNPKLAALAMNQSDEAREAFSADDNLAAEIEPRPIPTDAASIFAGCSAMRDSLNTAGRARGRRRWLAELSVLAFAENGQEYLHQVSEQHPDYDPEEVDRVWASTQQKIEDKRLGPATCVTIRQARADAGQPDVCIGCPHWNHNGKDGQSSPKVLGHKPVPFAPTGNASAAATAHMPTIMPDPLARLSEEHRALVLAHMDLPYIEREQQRHVLAEKLKVRVSVIDELSKQLQPVSLKEEPEPAGRGRVLDLPEPEPCPEPVDLAEVLAEVVTILHRFVDMPNDSLVCVALWIMHTYVFEHGPITPRLLIRSPEKRCGKSTLLDLIGMLARKALTTTNITPAALARVVEACRPTLLLDEGDTFIKGDNEELRGVINSGHKFNGSITRVVTVGDDFEVRCFSTFCPTAIAMIGSPPGTIVDRSVIVDLQRSGRKLDRLRGDRERQFDTIRRKLARAALQLIPTLRDADPPMPAELHARACDNARPLLVIAEAMGDGVLKLACDALVQAAKRSGEEDDNSLRIALLTDLHEIFDEHRAKVLAAPSNSSKARTTMAKAAKAKDIDDPDFVQTSAILMALRERDERPWGEENSRDRLTSHKLARMLKHFGIRATRTNSSRGYRRTAFEDAWKRYLPHVRA